MIHSTAEKMWVLAFMGMLVWHTLLIHSHNWGPSTHRGRAFPGGGITFLRMDNWSHQIKKRHPRMHCKLWQRAQGFELAYKLSGSHFCWAFMRSDGTSWKRSFAHQSTRPKGCTTMSRCPSARNHRTPQRCPVLGCRAMCSVCSSMIGFIAQELTNVENRNISWALLLQYFKPSTLSRHNKSWLVVWWMTFCNSTQSD